MKIIPFVTIEMFNELIDSDWPIKLYELQEEYSQILNKYRIEEFKAKFNYWGMDEWNKWVKQLSPKSITNLYKDIQQFINENNRSI